ncbi:hypothetical protein BJI67_00830 [Acidihalobacter aeolianus]|uniref:SPOR domain-containing protein n=1 Tax=Acidihalobacter aeolianus TaxID=2792603 RepID=A0A1D8K4A2_9GAMM|nr:SPOR domain-containing protein [Acidihalobacter aeolianus]AOV15798.1 hypothetical protein BJI67_00830 [Acidihalobacter aeolianus]
MAQHDYKSSSSRKGRGKGGKRGAPGWAWLAVGLAIGLFAGFLLYLSKRPAPPHHSLFSLPPAPASHEKKPAAKPSPALGASTTAPAQPKFDFYTLLPKLKVEVPKPPASLNQGQGATSANPAPVAPSAPEKVTAPGRYLLQVASFGTAGQANVLKAKLAFQGIVATVSPAKVKDYTWYRVQIGPFSDIAKVNAMLDQLSKQHYKPLIIKMNG